jgi:hypothetical protein
LTLAPDSYNLSITQGKKNMARKLTNKQIVDGINTVDENYFKACNAKGLRDDTRIFLESKWAHFRDMAVLLSQKNPSNLEEMVWTSQSWRVECERIAAEASK